MSEVTTIGLDLAKHVFQVHGVDASGAVVLRKQLRRSQVVAFFATLPSCLVGLEAWATAHYWARELRAVGHEVRLMPAQYIKAYVLRNKNGAADAAAICEAVGRPSMRFVAIKTAEQQAALPAVGVAAPASRNSILQGLVRTLDPALGRARICADYVDVESVQCPAKLGHAITT